MKWWLPRCTGMTLHQLRFAALLSSVLPDQISASSQSDSNCQAARSTIHPHAFSRLSAKLTLTIWSASWQLKAQVKLCNRELTIWRAAAGWLQAHFSPRLVHQWFQARYDDDDDHPGSSGHFSPKTSVLTLWKLRKWPHKIFPLNHPGKPIHPTFTSNFPNRQSNNY